MNKKLIHYIIFSAIFASAALAASDSSSQGFIWKPVLFYGLILGFYELTLIHADENFSGSHWLGHGVQAIGFMMIAILAVLNVEQAMNLTGFNNLGIAQWLKSPWTFRILIGLILNIKIHSVSAVIHTSGFAARGMAEHWSHTMIVSALVILVPLLHPFVSTLLSGTFLGWFFV